MPSYPSIPGPAIPTPAPVDREEQQERIMTFWLAFMVDRCWSVAAKLPVVLPGPPPTIQTPWPSPLPVNPSMSTAAIASSSLFVPVSSSSRRFLFRHVG